MTDKELYTLRFPIGEFKKPNIITKTHINQWISELGTFPIRLKILTSALDEEALSYRYRPKGWTLKQVVHHCADSHINSLVRFKLGLTENNPIIRPYFEDRFAKLTDYAESIDSALLILEGVHSKLVSLLKNLDDHQLQRTFLHPEHHKQFTIEETIGVYAWHSNHHLAHVEQALKFRQKFSD